MLRQLLLETRMTSYGPPQEQAGHNFSIAYKAGVELPDLSAEAAKALTGARARLGAALWCLSGTRESIGSKALRRHTLACPKKISDPSCHNPE